MTELVCVPGHGILHLKFGPGNRRSGNVINNQRYFMGGRTKRFRCEEGVCPQPNQVTIMVWLPEGAPGKSESRYSTGSFLFLPFFPSFSCFHLRFTLADSQHYFRNVPYLFFFLGSISLVKRATEICNVNLPFCRGSVE